MKAKRVILDTNLWISFLISNDLNGIDLLIEKDKIKLVFSDELIQEFISVATRPKFKKYFTNDDIEDILRLFDIYGKIIKVKSRTNECRDPKDNFLLNLALDSKADYLVTGDSDLLDLKTTGKTKIVTYKEFIEKIN